MARKREKKKPWQRIEILAAVITAIATIIAAVIAIIPDLKSIPSVITVEVSSTPVPTQTLIFPIADLQINNTSTFIPTSTGTPTFIPTTTFTVTNTFTPTPFVMLDNDVPMILIPRGAFNKYDKQNGFIQISLPDFFIDQHEVTNFQYQQCVVAGVCKEPYEAGKEYKNVEHFGDENYKDYPVVLVSWNMANTYCEWRGSGTRMPSGEEWEKAARGLLVDQTYPWGNNPPTCEGGTLNGTNYFGCNTRDAFPVMRFSPNGYGIYDMAGNVSEWVDEGNHLIRGGSWLDSESRIKVFSVVEGETFEGYVNVGFRCARDANR